MKLSDFALGLSLSLGLVGVAGAQPLENVPKAAKDVQIDIDNARPTDAAILFANNVAGPDVGSASATAGEPGDTSSPSSRPQAPTRPPVGQQPKYDQWRLSVTPYLWFPGIHGNIGALNRDVSVHASATDLLSHFRFGLMAHVEARRNRFVLPLDVFWIRLGDDRALPFPFLGAATADVKVRAFILTPKVGYRFIDEEKIKVDALTGVRYWHLGQSLKFSPSILNLDLSLSQNWVDPLVGVRIGTPL